MLPSLRSSSDLLRAKSKRRSSIRSGTSARRSRMMLMLRLGIGDFLLGVARGRTCTFPLSQRSLPNFSSVRSLTPSAFSPGICSLQALVVRQSTVNQLAMEGKVCTCLATLTLPHPLPHTSFSAFSAALFGSRTHRISFFFPALDPPCLSKTLLFLRLPCHQTPHNKAPPSPFSPCRTILRITSGLHSLYRPGWIVKLCMTENTPLAVSSPVHERNKPQGRVVKQESIIT